MKIKFLFLFIAGAFAISSSATAQSSIAFGVQAGAVFAQWKADNDGEKETTGMKTGFTLGVLADMAISDNFSFQPSLNYTQKGFKEEEDDVSYTGTLNYLELPLNFVYKTSDNGSGRFFVGAGPVLGFAIGGKSKIEVGGVEEEEDFNIGSDDGDDVKPFDLGVNLMIGYQLPAGIFLSANYTPGIINIAPGAEDNQSLKNSTFGIKIGYMFGGRSASN